MRGRSDFYRPYDCSHHERELLKSPEPTEATAQDEAIDALGKPKRFRLPRSKKERLSRILRGSVEVYTTIKQILEGLFERKAVKFVKCRVHLLEEVNATNPKSKPPTKVPNKQVKTLRWSILETINSR